MPEQEAGEKKKKFPLDASAFLSIQEQMSAFPPGDAAPPLDIVFFFSFLKGDKTLMRCSSHYAEATLYKTLTI